MKTILLIGLALASLALVVACNGDGGDGGATPSPDVSPDTTAQSQEDGTPIATETPAPTPPGEEVCQPNPDPATPEFQVVDQPGQGDTVTSPVTISGQVIAFEGTYQIGIFNAAGDPIVETFGTAVGTEIGELAPLSIDVPFEVDEPTPACIWVYEASARDGSPINVGQIPVLLQP